MNFNCYDQCKEIKRLENEISNLRYSILHLLPFEIHMTLQSYFRCPPADIYNWREDTINKIIELAIPVTDNTSVWSNAVRAVCPLCGETPQMENGFALPDGLHRHLDGYGNMRQCIFMKAANNLAHEYWDKNNIKELHEKEKQEAYTKRLNTETLYQISPNKTSLIDGNRPWHTPRSIDNFDWVDQRLTSLGFIISTTKLPAGNISKSYTMSTKKFIAFADPRPNSSIDINVFINNGKKKEFIDAFKLPDHWKNKLPEKLQTFFDSCLNKITGD